MLCGGKSRSKAAAFDPRLAAVAHPGEAGFAGSPPSDSSAAFSRSRDDLCFQAFDTAAP